MEHTVAPAGRPSKREAAPREPATLTAACDAGMRFPCERRQRNRRKRSHKTNQPQGTLAHNGCSWRKSDNFVGDSTAHRWAFFNFDRKSAGMLREMAGGGVEVEGFNSTTLLVAVNTSWSTSGHYTLQVTARPLQHSDALNADRCFYILVGALASDLFAVGIDINDAVVTLERHRGVNRTRILAVADPSLSEESVQLTIRVRGGDLVVTKKQSIILAHRLQCLARGCRVGVMVAKSRCAVEAWSIVDHEAETLAVASQAAGSAARAVALAVAAANDASKRNSGGNCLPVLPTVASERRREALREAASYRPTQRPDIGLLCNGCSRPFTKLGEPLVLWRPHQHQAIPLRFHDSRANDEDPVILDRNVCFTTFVENQYLGRQHRNGANYADAWFRARFEDRDGIEQRRLRDIARSWRTSPGEFVRAGSVAAERPDGSKVYSGPLSKAAYSTLLKACVSPADSGECPICFQRLTQRSEAPCLDDKFTPANSDDKNQNGADLVLRLPCAKQHAFHEACLRPWFQRCSLCPTCRTDVKPLLRPVSSGPQGPSVVPASAYSSRPIFNAIVEKVAHARPKAGEMLCVARLRPARSRIAHSAASNACQGTTMLRGA